MNALEIFDKVLDAMALEYDVQVTISHTWRLRGANAVQQMLDAGAVIDDDGIERIAFGLDEDREEHYSQFAGWRDLDALLEQIFENL